MKIKISLLITPNTGLGKQTYHLEFTESPFEYPISPASCNLPFIGVITEKMEDDDEITFTKESFDCFIKDLVSG